MKVFTSLSQAQVISDVKLRPDNVIINSGKEIYLPDWIEELTYMPVLIVRVAKVVKAIEPQYGERYYEVATLGLDLRADKVKEGIPEFMSYSFDNALMRGDYWLDLEEIKSQGARVVTSRFSEIVPEELPELQFPSDEQIHKTLALVSNYYLIKIGDLLTFPLWTAHRPIKPGMGILVVDKRDQELLYYGIK